MTYSIFTKKGTYVAVLCSTNFDRFYTRVFSYPGMEHANGGDAAWYYLNVVDFSGCLDRVYPIEIFGSLSRWKSKYFV